MKYNFNYLKNIFKNSSIHNYNYVYIYNDLRFFLAQNINDTDFIDKLLNIFLEKKQTIIIPSFSYSKKKYELQNTKSEVGFLSNYILKKKNSLRSEHPLFSYVALGPKKNIVKKIDKSAFGSDSLHSRLLFKNACFLHIGRNLKYGNTLVHHIEQNLNANYRFDKIFKTKVYKNNKYIGTNFKAFVRKNYKKKYSFTFNKILKKNELKKMINYLNHEKEFKSIFYYSYDKFYFFLHELYLKENNIFINSKY